MIFFFFSGFRLVGHSSVWSPHLEIPFFVRVKWILFAHFNIFSLEKARDATLTINYGTSHQASQIRLVKGSFDRNWKADRTDGRTDEWMDGRTDGWMDGWTDGWMDGQFVKMLGST